METEQMVACPRCGSDPELVRVYDNSEITMAQCSNENCGHPSATGRDKAMARKLWNIRAGGRKPAMPETGGTKGVGMSDLLGAVVKFIQGKLADSKRTLKCREDMQKVWSEGTDESWRAVGNRMTKAQRLIESDMHGRIAAKNRKEMDMFKATLSALQQAPNKSS